MKTKAKSNRKELVERAAEIIEAHLATLAPSERKLRRKAIHDAVTNENESGHKAQRFAETSRNRR